MNDLVGTVEDKLDLVTLSNMWHDIEVDMEVYEDDD